MVIDYYKSDYIKFKIEKFILTIPTDIKFETFNDPKNYYGIIFKYKSYKYEIVDCLLGPRIIINGKEGECKDMPFNLGTASFLPEFITVSKIT